MYIRHIGDAVTHAFENSKACFFVVLFMLEEEQYVRLCSNTNIALCSRFVNCKVRRMHAGEKTLKKKKMRKHVNIKLKF